MVNLGDGLAWQARYILLYCCVQPLLSFSSCCPWTDFYLQGFVISTSPLYHAALVVEDWWRPPTQQVNICNICDNPFFPFCSSPTGSGTWATGLDVFLDLLSWRLFPWLPLLSLSSGDGPNKIGAILQRCRSITLQNIPAKRIHCIFSKPWLNASLFWTHWSERIVHCLARKSISFVQYLVQLILPWPFSDCILKKNRTLRSSQQLYLYGMPRSEEPNLDKIAFSQSNFGRTTLPQKNPHYCLELVASLA